MTDPILSNSNDLGDQLAVDYLFFFYFFLVGGIIYLEKIDVGLFVRSGDKTSSLGHWIPMAENVPLTYNH